jgi:integrase/recombinase XerD
MKKKITLKRIFHRDSLRIAIYFSYDEELKKRVKSIQGIQYSNSNKCFYASDTEENLKVILKTFVDIADIDTEQLTDHGNIEKIQNEKVIPDEISVTYDYPVTVRKASGSVELRINESSGYLIIKLPIPYSPEWVDELRSFRGSRYNGATREWSMPWSKLACDSLADYFSRKGVDVDVKKETVDDALRLERKRIGDDVRDRKPGRKALDGLDSLAMYLDENRYSTRTREAYLSMIDFFFRYFSDKDPMEISSSEMSRFIYEFIIKLGYSVSYQNQMVSAIKTFYTMQGEKSLNIEVPGRPRRNRSLPKTFSKEEVVRILNSPGNIKHKLLLWIIYSCGLRRSEVTNIKLKDMDRNRSIIHIREGKGMVDRIVPVPAKVWNKVDEYLAGYLPREYLFEGQTGGRYSSESVYRVFKSALERAGIKKDVGVHSLRHSYATHLHENGLDIRYIQELLGHKSTRTTEIYTHVSRRNLISVRSPIEDLDVK